MSEDNEEEKKSLTPEKRFEILRQKFSETQDIAWLEEFEALFNTSKRGFRTDEISEAEAIYTRLRATSDPENPDLLQVNLTDDDEELLSPMIDTIERALYPDRFDVDDTFDIWRDEENK